MEPTYEYIVALWAEIENDSATQVRRAMDAEAKEIYFDTVAVDFPEDLSNPVKLCLRLVYDVMQRIKGVLSTEPKITLEDMGVSQVAQRLSRKIESGVNALFNQMEHEAPRRIVRPKIREDQIGVGRGYGKLMYAPDQWASYDAWVRDTLPELQSQAKKFETAEEVEKALKAIRGFEVDEKAYTLLPLAFRHIFAPSVYPVPGSVEEYIVFSRRRVKEILAGLDKGIYEGAPKLVEAYNRQSAGAARAQFEMQEVDFLEYYSDTHFAYIAKGGPYAGWGENKSGELIRLEEHGYRMCPIVEFPGDTTSDPEHPYMGMFYPVIGIVKGLNDLMSQMFTNIRHWRWLTLFQQMKGVVNPGDDSERPKPYPIAIGKINPMYEGETLLSLANLIGPLNIEIPQLWGFLRDLFSEMTLAPVLAGIAAGGVTSGYPMALQRQNALTRWNNLVQNYNRGVERLAVLALNIIKYRVGESVVVHTGLAGESRKAIIELDPKEFPAHPMFYADYQLSLPVDKAAMMQLALQGTARRGEQPPLFDYIWGRELLEDENPLETEKRVLAQEWMQSPAMREFFTAEAVKEAGIALKPSAVDNSRAMLEMNGMGNIPPNMREAMMRYTSGRGQGVVPETLEAQEGMGFPGGRVAGQAVQPGGPNLPEGTEALP